MATMTSYEAALETLQGMFPSFDASTLGAVYLSCGENVETSVSQLLQMGPQGGISASAAAPSSTADSAPKRWRHKLPDDFLQVPGSSLPAISSTTSGQLSQDQMLAQMLGDELFMEELRHNPDLAAYLEAEQGYFDGRSHASAPSAPSGPSWGDKLASMGGEMKRKFNSVALSFAKAKQKLAAKSAESAPGGYGVIRDDDGEMGTSLLVAADNGDEVAGARRRRTTAVDDE